MKTKRFDFNFRPLQLQRSFSVVGSVPDTQSYNADTGEYTPDYTLTPLIIQPNVSIIDKDDVLSPGSVNISLTNIKWYEIIDSVSTLISSSNTDYEITSSGSTAGRIKVNKNIEPAVPITLQFYAEYIDSRNSQILTIQGTHQVKCNSASDLVRVELDAASQSIYNPFADSDTQIVTATIWVGESVCAASKYTLVWEIQGEDNTWHEAGTDEIMDYQIATSGNTATVNKKLMGAALNLRCRCKYSAEGDPDDVELSDATPQATVSFVRRLPKFEFDMTGVPYNIPYGLLAIAPEAVIQTTNGSITSPEKELLPLWYIATNKASGSLSYSLVGHGLNPTIPTDALSATYGAVLALDVVDRGHWGAWEDGDGAIICDADGKILLIK